MDKIKSWVWDNWISYSMSKVPPKERKKINLAFIKLFECTTLRQRKIFFNKKEMLIYPNGILKKIEEIIKNKTLF